MIHLEHQKNGKWRKFSNNILTNAAFNYSVAVLEVTCEATDNEEKQFASMQAYFECLQIDLKETKVTNLTCKKCLCYIFPSKLEAYR